ncbi:RcnB family protein [Cupriavidus necator]
MNTKKAMPALLLAASVLVAPLAMAQAQGGAGTTGTPGTTGTTGATGTPDPTSTPGTPGATTAPGPATTPGPTATPGPTSTPGATGTTGTRGTRGTARPTTDPMTAAPAAQSSPYMQVQQWKKGDRLPTEFRDRQYVIDDYKQYNLPAPRKGTRWVGVGAEYYLVAPNGVIQQVGSGS